MTAAAGGAGERKSGGADVDDGAGRKGGGGLSHLRPRQRSEVLEAQELPAKITCSGGPAAGHHLTSYTLHHH